MNSAPTIATQRTKRLHVLDAAELAALYDRPRFTDDERAYYFTLTPTETVLMQTFTDGAVQAFFVLPLGYFKAKQRFFSVKLADVLADLMCIVNQLDLRVTADDLRLLNPRTIQQQRQHILDYTHYQQARAAERQQMDHVVLQAARMSPKPQYLLRMLLQFCANQRIILPGYTTVQETIIGKAITAEEHRLGELLQTFLTAHDLAALARLFEKHDGRYRLTNLQRLPKDLRHGQLRRERDRSAELLPFYELVQRILPLLGLSHEGIAYYASLVGYYTAIRLNELDSPMVAVYLLCFLHHRYHRLHDHLLSGFMHAVKGYRDDATATAQAQSAAYRMTLTEDLVRAGQVLQIFTDEHIPPELPFATLQERAFGLLQRERLHHTATSMMTGAGYDEMALFWQAIDAMHRRFKGRLRPLLHRVRFTGTSGQRALLEAVTFLQERFARDTSLVHAPAQRIPTRCIPVRLKRYLYTKSATGEPELIRDRYEFLVYQLIRAALEAGDLSCQQSVRFRSIEDDLIPITAWQEHKAVYLAEIQLPLLQQPITEHLTALKQDLEALFARVNGRITMGDNPAVHVHAAWYRAALDAPEFQSSGSDQPRTV